MTNNDNNKDKSDQENTTAPQKTTDKYAAAKETQNKILLKTDLIVEKIFTVAKATTKDVVQELRNVNTIRKETAATFNEKTKITDLAKTFWVKTSGKQRSIVFGISALIVFVAVLATQTNKFEQYAYEQCVVEGKHTKAVCSCYSKKLDQLLTEQEKLNYKSANEGNLAAALDLFKLLDKFTIALFQCSKS